MRRDWPRLANAGLIAAALAVIPVLVLEETVHGGPFVIVAEVLDWTIWSALALELVVLLVRAENRREWPWKHPFDVAIVLLTPPFLASGGRSRRSPPWAATSSRGPTADA